MKHTLPYVYLAGALLVPPMMALAHGGIDDGHVETEPVADPASRKYVMIAVAAVFVLMIGWFVWSKIKSKAPMN